MSLRLTPAPSHPTTTSRDPGAPSAPGVHDTLRTRLNASSTTPITSSSQSSSNSSTHPLESRLTSWRATQDTLKMTLLRAQFGIAEPVKRQMELAIVGHGEMGRMDCMQGAYGFASGVHGDILANRDAEVGWEDVFHTREEVGGGREFHAEVEGRAGSW